MSPSKKVRTYMLVAIMLAGGSRWVSVLASPACTALFRPLRRGR
jgi:hypothetical protein